MNFFLLIFLIWAIKFSIFMKIREKRTRRYYYFYMESLVFIIIERIIWAYECFRSIYWSGYGTRRIPPDWSLDPVKIWKNRKCSRDVWNYSRWMCIYGAKYAILIISQRIVLQIMHFKCHKFTNLYLFFKMSSTIWMLQIW